MSAGSCWQRLRAEATCPICLEYFAEPVSLDCGHNFCRACILRSWEEPLPFSAACPQCRARPPEKRLRPNRQLASVVQIARDLSSLPEIGVESGEPRGGLPEPLRLFCTDGEGRVCLLCDGSPDPRAFRVLSVAEAVQECKNLCTCSLEILRKERECIFVYQAENEEEGQGLLKEMGAEREKVAATFGQLHQFLVEQENLLLAQMADMENEIAGRRDEHQIRLSVELSSLDNLIRELEEKQQQSANELLQNVGNIIEWYKKESFDNPVAFPAALKWKIHDICDINPCLVAITNQFKDSLASGLQLQKANVILDQDTAHPELILSEDCKSVRYRDEHQDLPDNPERFDNWPFVLGCEGFTTGRFFWEVAVGREEEWAVGVARKSMRRKGAFKCNPEEGVWDVGVWGGEFGVSVLPDYPPLPLSQELKKIRVTLNCAAGCVAFFDADTGAKLYVYSDASFCGETLLPFFYVSEGGHLTICP